MKTNTLVLFALILTKTALANVAGDCLLEYAECQGTKGFVSNPVDWNYKPGAWRLIQIFNGYAIYGFEGHAKFRVAVNAKSLSDYAQAQIQPGWSLTRSLGMATPCLMFDSVVKMKSADGFPVDVRAYWAGECPKELQK